MKNALLSLLISIFIFACGDSSNTVQSADEELKTEEVAEADTTKDTLDSIQETPQDTSQLEQPVVEQNATYELVIEEDVEYAKGLSFDPTNNSSVEASLKLDIYSPDNSSDNRPVFMFIHGGGFTGGIKHKPEIVDMANYYASRGWVFVSIDYRTTEELGTIQGMTPEQLLTFYRGIAPQEWIEYALQGASNSKEVQQSIAMYMAQRDAKAALRWIVANANTYNINTDYITVGGASAGSVTTIALGISNLEDFRDEITISDDPTLSTTNIDETYEVKSMVYFWGSNQKLDLFEAVYGLEQYDRYDSNDPELFMAHGDQFDPVTPYDEAIELQGIYDSIGVHSELVTLEGYGHGAWEAEVDGQGLSEMSFDFIVERQGLIVE